MKDSAGFQLLSPSSLQPGYNQFNACFTLSLFAKAQCRDHAENCDSTGNTVLDKCLDVYAKNLLYVQQLSIWAISSLLAHYFSF